MRLSPLCLDQAQADQEHGWTSHLQLPFGPQVTRGPKRRIHASELKGLISFKQTVSLNSSSLWPKSEERTELQTNTCNQSQSNPHFILTQSHLAIISSNDCPGFAGTLNHPGPPSSLPGNWPAHKHSDSNVQLHSEFKTVALNVRQPLILTNTVVS